MRTNKTRRTLSKYKHNERNKVRKIPVGTPPQKTFGPNNRVWEETLTGKTQLGRPRLRWRDNIAGDLKPTGMMDRMDDT